MEKGGTSRRMLLAILLTAFVIVQVGILAFIVVRLLVD